MFRLAKLDLACRLSYRRIPREIAHLFWDEFRSGCSRQPGANMSGGAVRQGKTCSGQGCQTDRSTLKPSGLASVKVNCWKMAVCQELRVPSRDIFDPGECKHRKLHTRLRERLDGTFPEAVFSRAFYGSSHHSRVVMFRPDRCDWKNSRPD